MLDLGLPGIDGLAVCRRLRAKGVATPILMLTARDAVPDRVAGLEAGADDYLVKPFAIDELVARLHALERRGSDPRETIAHGELILEPARRQASRGGRSIELTGRETALLELLLRQPGRTLTRERAIEDIWSGAAEPNVVDRYVTRLRRKLGDPPLIRTVRGYRVRAGRPGLSGADMPRPALSGLMPRTLRGRLILLCAGVLDRRRGGVRGAEHRARQP